MGLIQSESKKETALDAESVSRVKRLITACVTTAQNMPQALVTQCLGTYFRLTGSLPRKLPTTTEEYLKLRERLVLYFGLDDGDPAVWATVSGQITSTPATSMYKSYRAMANAGLRLKVNLVAHNEKVIAVNAIRAKLESLGVRVDDGVGQGQEKAPDGAVL